MEKSEHTSTAVGGKVPKDGLNGFVRLVYFVQIVILLNLVFCYFGLPKTYLAAVAFGYVFLLFKLHSRTLGLGHLIKLAYFFSVLITGILHLVLYPSTDPQQIIYGMFIYMLLPGFWFLISFCTGDSENLLKELFWKLRYVIIATSLLGIVQYFFAPTMFGLQNEDSSRQLMFLAEGNLEFTDYVTFFRATSLWSSPQICGLYLSLYIIGYYSFFGHTLSTFFTLLPCFMCGVLTSNKSFLLNMLLFFFLKFKISILWKSLCVVSGILILSLGVTGNMDNAVFDRLLSVDRIIEEETAKESRFEIYKRLLSECIPWGNGVGSLQNNKFHNSERVAESFLLQILYEMGFLPCALFLLILFLQFRSCPKKLRLLMFAAFSSMIYIHAFNSIHMMFFYSLVFLDFSKREAPGCPSDAGKTEKCLMG